MMLKAIAVMLLVCVLAATGALGQQGIATKPAQQVKDNRISANNTVLLLLDHQVRSATTVASFGPARALLA
jgi:hypothetical protein